MRTMMPVDTHTKKTFSIRSKGLDKKEISEYHHHRRSTDYTRTLMVKRYKKNQLSEFDKNAHYTTKEDLSKRKPS